MKTETKVIVIHENVRESLTNDAITFSMALGTMMLGLWMQSTAMQWFGFIVATMGLIHRFNKRARFTIEEARKELDALEAKMKGGAA